MASSSPSDLAGHPAWHGLRLGMTHDEVVELLDANGQGHAADVGEPAWIMVDDWSLDLHFEEGTGDADDDDDAEGTAPLCQLAVEEGGEFVWDGIPLLGQALGDVLPRLGPRADGAFWRPENAFDHLDYATWRERDCSDEALVRTGTLWLPRHQLGLALHHGDVEAVVWRRPEDMPREHAGLLTEQQRAFLARADLYDVLAASAAASSRRTRNGFKLPLTALLILALIGLGVFSFQENRAWQSAPKAAATITTLGDAEYGIRWTGEAGEALTATLPRRDFHIPPRAIGETVEIHYLPTEPPVAHGPAADRDRLFLRFVPLVIGLVSVYLALVIVTDWVSARLARKPMTGPAASSPEEPTVREI